jgi:hypothetical protein
MPHARCVIACGLWAVEIFHRCCENLQGFKRLGEPKAAVEYDPQELITFISKNFIPLNTMMELAGMSETDIYHRTRDIFLYFKLPYDSEPPVG